jgi:hypothetical protein
VRARAALSRRDVERPELMTGRIWCEVEQTGRRGVESDAGRRSRRREAAGHIVGVRVCRRERSIRRVERTEGTRKWLARHRSHNGRRVDKNAPFMDGRLRSSGRALD